MSELSFHRNADHVATRTFKRFGAQHGISFSELRSGFYKNAAGRIFAGGLDGFIEFYPDSISGVTHPPEIAITSISVFDNELPVSSVGASEMTFPHDQNFLSFSFAALDYINPSNNRFAYKMDGVDLGWVEAGTRNYARYPNLNPGSLEMREKLHSSCFDQFSFWIEID